MLKWRDIQLSLSLASLHFLIKQTWFDASPPDMKQINRTAVKQINSHILPVIKSSIIDFFQSVWSLWSLSIEARHNLDTQATDGDVWIWNNFRGTWHCLVHLCVYWSWITMISCSAEVMVRVQSNLNWLLKLWSSHDHETLPFNLHSPDGLIILGRQILAWHNAKTDC